MQLQCRDQLLCHWNGRLKTAARSKQSREEVISRTSHFISALQSFPYHGWPCLETCKRDGYFDKDIHQKLQDMGMDRTLVALRSKLYGLRKDPAVYDDGHWKEEAVQRLLRKVEEERGEREKERDQAHYDRA
jgi:hypothetical protein